MKCSVRIDFALVVSVVALTLAVVAITDASAGATQLILIGFLAVAMAIRLGPERLQLWREEHGRAARRKS
jgi:hypothetical protein